MLFFLLFYSIMRGLAVQADAGLTVQAHALRAGFLALLGI